MAPDRLTRTFKKLTALAGLPPIRLHDLRHGAASLALSAGVELKVAQEMLGHSRTVGAAPACDDQRPQVTEPHAGHGTRVLNPQHRKLTEDTRSELARRAGCRLARTQRTLLLRTARLGASISNSSRPQDGLSPAPHMIISDGVMGV
jgi:hypothetical protein